MKSDHMFPEPSYILIIIFALLISVFYFCRNYLGFGYMEIKRKKYCSDSLALSSRNTPYNNDILANFKMFQPYFLQRDYNAFYFSMQHKMQLPMVLNLGTSPPWIDCIYNYLSTMIRTYTPHITVYRPISHWACRSTTSILTK